MASKPSCFRLSRSASAGQAPPASLLASTQYRSRRSPRGYEKGGSNPLSFLAREGTSSLDGRNDVLADVDEQAA